MFNENEKNNDIDDDYYLQLKDIINVNLDNKYQLGIPGYKIYSFYVIQDILKLLEDTFSLQCIVKYKKKNKYGEIEIYNSYIYDCSKSCFIEDIISLQTDDPTFKLEKFEYNKFI